MNNMDYRLYVEIIPRNLTVENDIYPFEYETAEPTESIYVGDDYISYINATTHPVCSPIPNRVPSREPAPSWNKTAQPVVAYRIYYTTETILYGVNISIGVVIFCIIVVYFYKWYEKNRKKIENAQIRETIPKTPKYNGVGENPPEHTNYNSDF